MAEAKWYLAKDEKALGPFTLAELKRMATAGSVGRDDLLCPEGGSEWVAATTVPGLFPSPPPLPPRPGGTTSLVPCAKCEKSVSDEATTCPHCGERQPKQDQLDGEYDGGKCERCGTFNLIGSPHGFFTGPGHACRGCRRPIPEAYPTAHVLSEMEKIHRNSLGIGRLTGAVTAVGCGALALLVYRAAGWDAPCLIPVALILVAYAYGGGRALGMLVVRGRAARSGFGDPSPLAERVRDYVAVNPSEWGSLESFCSGESLSDRNVRDWNQNGGYVYLPRRGKDAPQATGATAPPRGFSSRWKWVALGAVVVIGGVYMYQTEFSQYALGRKAGIRHVREMSKKGPFIRAGMNAAKMIDLIPNNPDASADWNAGFRAGFKEELERMYPETKGR